MRVALVVLCAAVMAGDIGAQSVPPPVPAPAVGGDITHKRRSARKEAQRKEKIKREGGLVTKVATGKCVRFVDAQKLVDRSVIDEATRSIERQLHLNYEVVSGELGKSYRPDDNAAAVIAVIESDVEPAILVAPENAWAVVNVSALSKDSPQKGVLATRVIKEIWRAFAMAMGASNSPYQPCIMRPIYKPSDLDESPMTSPSPFPFNAILRTAKDLKIGERNTTTYQRACQEGWAPQPTNGVQKAIWDRVHAMPDSPITIEKK